MDPKSVEKMTDEQREAHLQKLRDQQPHTKNTPGGPKVDFGLAQNVKCFHCDNIVPHMFAFLVGTENCMCVQCQEAFRRIEDQELLDPEAERMAKENRVELLRNRCRRSGIPASVVTTIGLTPEHPDPDLPGKTSLTEATRKYFEAENKGLLCLSGHNGSGKTVCGGWASYRTRGRFIQRSEWSMIPSTEDGQKQVLEIISLPGIVTLDEVLSLSSAGDSTTSIRNVLTICCERADHYRGTILTTRCVDKKRFDSVFGNDMLDRMLALRDSGGSGWVTSDEKVSMRVTHGRGHTAID